MPRTSFRGWWLGLAAAAAACSHSPARQSSLTVTDDAGDTVVLAQPARRIVSLIPAATELLFAMGAGPAVVGRTSWCDAPAEALAVTSLGDGLEPNVEAVLAVAPDLVVLYPSPRTATAAARFRGLGVPAVQLRTDRLNDLARSVAILGRLTGRAAAADSLVRASDSALAAVRHGRADGPLVLIVVWDQPPMTVGRGSFLHELVELAGGRNAFGDIEQPSAAVSLEAIVARNPDVILAIGTRPSFAGRPEWQAVPAVREGRFVLVQGSEFLRPTPRAAAAVAQLRQQFSRLPSR